MRFCVDKLLKFKTAKEIMRMRTALTPRISFLPRDFSPRAFRIESRSQKAIPNFIELKIELVKMREIDSPSPIR